MAEHIDPATDPTLNPNLKSWLESANDVATDFPLTNLPFCTFTSPDVDDEAALSKIPDNELFDHIRPKLGIAAGDCVIDLDMLMHAGQFDAGKLNGQELDDEFFEVLHSCLHHGGLNELVGLEPEFARFLREQAQAFLLDGIPGGQQGRRLRQKAVTPMKDVRLTLPVTPPNYTDFYASVHHASNVGAMFRPDNPLLPNYKHVPIGYHGRASSIVASGTDIRRPHGQTNIENAPVPSFGPCKRLDYELELGAIVGMGNTLGEPIAIKDVARHIFGYVLLNDWSARDVQAWEYQPLGPFLAKNFASTISPFVVTKDAMRPFMVAGPARTAEDPQPLDYLRTSEQWGLDITLEVFIQSEQMRKAGTPAMRVSRGNVKDMYWTVAQMVAHHTVNGCNLEPGDLLGSGTVSGPGEDSRGCLLEMTWVGNGPDKKPLPRKAIELPSGEKRMFLEDGDEVIFRGSCQREGFKRIGFGECRGRILAARK